MAYWLLKSEPETWSWDEQVARGAKGEPWTGVRNYQARNKLREMKAGDRAFFYHSGKARSIVGVVEVIKEAYPDPTASDGDWSCVDVVAVKAFTTPVSIADVRAEASLAEMVLINNSRLSVQPVTAAEWKTVCAMGGIKA